jgi:chromosome segregation ATPase
MENVLDEILKKLESMNEKLDNIEIKLYDIEIKLDNSQKEIDSLCKHVPFVEALANSGVVSAIKQVNNIVYSINPLRFIGN